MIHIPLPLYFVLLLLSIVYAYYLRNKILKTAKADGPLTRTEQFGVLLTLIINVLMMGCIYYFSFNKKLPIKAKQINRYATAIFVVLVISFLVFHTPLFVFER